MFKSGKIVYFDVKDKELLRFPIQHHGQRQVRLRTANKCEYK